MLARSTMTTSSSFADGAESVEDGAVANDDVGVARERRSSAGAPSTQPPRWSKCGGNRVGSSWTN